METAVFVLWPSVRGQWAALQAALAGPGAPDFEILESRDIEIDPALWEPLLCDVYMRKHTALFPENRPKFYHVLEEKARLLAAAGNVLRAVRARYTGAGDVGAESERVKAELRRSAPAANPTPYKMNLNLHASDGAAEADYLADVLFSGTTFDHLKFRAGARPRDVFTDRLNTLRCWCAGMGVDPRDVCVVSGGVLEACDLRDAGDLDIVMTAQARARFPGAARLADGVDLAAAGYHRTAAGPGLSDDALIADPANHFNVMGVKFAALWVVADSKRHAGRAKDRKDSDLLARHAAAIEETRPACT